MTKPVIVEQGMDEGAPGGNRTPNSRLRRPVLFTVESGLTSSSLAALGWTEPEIAEKLAQIEHVAWVLARGRMPISSALAELGL